MRLIAGLDIGGTSIKCVLLDAEFAVVGLESFPKESMQGMKRTVDAIERAIKPMLEKAGGELAGIGIGCTGPVNIFTGVIENPYTLPGLEGHSITEALSARMNVPVRIDNDANTAHLGEVHGLSPCPENTLMLTFGTGVGCSVRLGGKLFRLPDGFHPEIGHISVGVDSPAVCYCGKSRCLENVLSGTAVNRDAEREFGTSPEKVLENLNPRGHREFRDRLVTALTEAVVNLTVVFKPELIFLGGGMKEFIEKYLLQGTRERTARLLRMYGGTMLVPSKKGEVAGSLGAALLAADL